MGARCSGVGVAVALFCVSPCASLCLAVTNSRRHVVCVWEKKKQVGLRLVVYQRFLDPPPPPLPASADVFYCVCKSPERKDRPGRYFQHGRFLGIFVPPLQSVGLFFIIIILENSN